jgi:hypothetical protein
MPRCRARIVGYVPFLFGIHISKEPSEDIFSQKNSWSIPGEHLLISVGNNDFYPPSR